jgi:ribosome-binding protein aMBF1 (putative translation factor)
MIYSTHMTSLENLKKQAFKNKNVKRYYDELEPEFSLIKLMIEKRLDKNLSQADLAKKIGTKQSAISRFESGSSNPTLQFVNKIAHALNVKLKISLF